MIKYWDNNSISETDVVIQAKDNLIDQDLIYNVSKALNQYGLAIVKKFNNSNDSIEQIKERCYNFGSKFGFFNPNTAYFYDVYDRGKETYTKSTRYSDTNLSHGPHTDGTKKENFPRYIILYCIEQAEEGGENSFINALSVRRKIEKDYPEVLAILADEIIRDVKESDKNHAENILQNSYPIFSYDNKYQDTIFRYMRRWIDIAYEKLSTPLSVELEAALDILDKILNDKKYIFSYKLQKGDLVISDNYFLAHDRTAYTDSKNKKRHMLRAWLYNTKGNMPC